VKRCLLPIRIATCLIVVAIILVGGPAWAYFPYVTTQDAPIEFDGGGVFFLPLGAGSTNTIYRQFTAPAESTVVIFFNGVCSVRATDTDTSVDLDILVLNDGQWHTIQPTVGINPLCTSDGTGTFSGPVSVSTNGEIGSQITISGGTSYLVVRAQLVNGTGTERGRLRPLHSEFL
jgi:hypothetical protein